MTSVPAAIQHFIDTTNAGDTEAFVDGFTADAYLEDWGRGFHGHDGVRSWDRTDNIGRQSHFELLGAREDGEVWVVTLRVSGNGYNGTGDMRFTVDGDRIARLIISA
ncbi:MAG TPA: nuclear transport factor 2 family protein [Gryllotalpicola sp.]